MQTYGDYDARVRESFARQAMMRSLGVEIVSVGAGDVVFEMPFGADFTKQHGFMHAGAITTVLDSADGFRHPAPARVGSPARYTGGDTATCDFQSCKIRIGRRLLREPIEVECESVGLYWLHAEWCHARRQQVWFDARNVCGPQGQQTDVRPAP